jgi:hypothetical protein
MQQYSVSSSILRFEHPNYSTYLHPKFSERVPPIAGPIHGASSAELAMVGMAESIGTYHRPKVEHGEITAPLPRLRNITNHASPYLRCEEEYQERGM